MPYRKRLGQQPFRKVEPCQQSFYWACKTKSQEYGDKPCILKLDNNRFKSSVKKSLGAAFYVKGKENSI